MEIALKRTGTYRFLRRSEWRISRGRKGTAVRESFDWEGVSHADGVPGPCGRSRREAMGGKKGRSNMRLAPERVARIQLRRRGWVGEWPPDIRLLSVQSASPQATSAAG